MSKRKTRNRILEGIALLFGILLLVYEISGLSFGNDETEKLLFDILISRTLGGIIFLFLCLRVRYRIFGSAEKKCVTGALLCFPALLVVVNNLPIIGLVTGNAYVERFDLFPVFILQCAAIGLYEEFAFRGFVFPYIMEKTGTTRRGVFLAIIASGGVFAVLHLINLLEGASLGSVILQIGYSFLIGAMCSVVLVKSRNIWICVLLHAIYDFCGFLVPTLGGGLIWDAATVTVTAILGVFTFFYMIYIFFKTDISEAEKIVQTNKNSK